MGVVYESPTFGRDGEIGDGHRRSFETTKPNEGDDCDDRIAE
jgi:hypothetical protein